VRQKSLWCVHREFSYKSPGKRILKISPHLPKLLSNIKQLTLFGTQCTFKCRRTVSHSALATENEPYNIPLDSCDWQAASSLLLLVCGDYNTALHTCHFSHNNVLTYNSRQLQLPATSHMQWTPAPPVTFRQVTVSRPHATKGVFIATQLDWTQLTQLNSVPPSQSCFCLYSYSHRLAAAFSFYMCKKLWILHQDWQFHCNLRMGLILDEKQCLLSLQSADVLVGWWFGSVVTHWPPST